MLKKNSNGDVYLESLKIKERYTCEITGAHFNYDDMCFTL